MAARNHNRRGHPHHHSHHPQHGAHSLPLVAPPEVLREDFRELDSRVLLRTSWGVEQLVLLQSVTGHAHEGHGVFHGRKFPNTTESDVARALSLDPEAVKAGRQELIDEIYDCAERAAAGGADRTPTNGAGEPLLGIGTLRSIEVDPEGLLQGLYIGGLRDRPEIRSEAERHYHVNIGWGACYLVNKQVMHQMGLSGDLLARQGHGDELEEFRKVGLIVDRLGDGVDYMYIRHKVGPGASDDAAMVAAGKLYGFSAAVGVFLADAIDTIEKFATKTEDQDADLAQHVEEAYPALGLSRDDACRLAYLAAAPEGREHEIPDSSLRGLLEVDRKYDICALESHLLYLAGRPVPEIDLDHGQSTNLEFYRYVEERLAQERAPDREA